MLSTLLFAASLGVGQVEAAPPSSAQNLLIPPAAGRATTAPSLISTQAYPPMPPAKPDAAKSGSGDEKKDDDKKKDNVDDPNAGFVKRFVREYPMMREWFPKWLGETKKDDSNDDEPEKPRRSFAAPLPSPPFPSGEWQGYPLIGVPYDDSVYPLMKAIYGGPWGDRIKESRIKMYGWVNASGNWSNAHNSNTPDSYWIVPNSPELDQIVLRLERQVDTVQQDHIDVGFRSTLLFGIDYRYMTAGGWFSQQLLRYNNLYGIDPTEQYIDVYIPRVLQGLVVRVGRWIACPDIETQFAPDNYMGTHSILFTFDTYTQTGVMLTLMLNKQWMLQAAIHAGTDMAPWYAGATPTGMFGIRWVSADNKDSVYVVLNSINDAEFRYFTEGGIPSGHDNFNYVVGTWQHKFGERVHTKTESYFMWQNDAVVGGTPSLGPIMPFGSGGGIGATLPGTSLAYGVLNYTMFKASKNDFITFRNEWWRDQRGMRSGFAGNYTSHAIGLSHNFSSTFQVRPEVGYYRNWDQPAFDLGTKPGIWIAGIDATLRF
jgi:hypothetical protein